MLNVNVKYLAESKTKAPPNSTWSLQIDYESSQR